MKKSTKTLIAIGLMFVVFVPLIPSYVLGWYAEDSVSDDRIFTRPRFSTHQWLAWEAVDMFPEAQMSWITENLYAFWHGVEAPFMGNASFSYGYEYGNYSDIDDLVLFLDGTGTTVTYSNLTVRAQEEYTKLVAELSLNDTNYEQAAFYAGTMSHYISQAGFFKAIWDNVTAPWGTLNSTLVNMFELAIERGNTKVYFNIPSFFYQYTNMTIYANDFFTLDPAKIAAVDAQTATEDLAKAIFPTAQDQYNDFNETIQYADDWETIYYDNVKDCLTYSVEAIYAALSHAMETINWRYITLPIPTFAFNNYTAILDIPEFEAQYHDENGVHILNDSMATAAEAWYIYNDDEDDTPAGMSTHPIDLEYNATTEKWLYNSSLAEWSTANVNNSIVYRFDMDRASSTYSNLSLDKFQVYYYNTSVTRLNYIYENSTRTLHIENVTAICYDLPEIGLIDPTDIDTARWILYQKGMGTTQTGEVVGIPMRDTEGTLIQGDLEYNATDGTWYSRDIDVGLVFTPSGVELYVVARFNLTIPVGYFKVSSVGGGVPLWKPYVQKQGTYFFRTRDHIVTISVPQLTYDFDIGLVSIYGVTAITDYGNVVLDYEEIVNKTVYGDDIRESRWKVFLYDGIASGLTGLLNWNESAQYWYAENINITSLPDNNYYVSAKIVNMNTNFTTSQWGPPSELFEVVRPIPIIYYILPEFFVAGFVVLFGWLAWYRPRQKKRLVEAERAEKLGKGFGD